jgi:nucleotide-binding universal stress UspA family protein
MQTKAWGIERVVVGIDGSEHAAAALDWAIGLARTMDAEIVAVHAVETSINVYYPLGVVPPVQYEPEWRAELKVAFEEDWARPLRESRLRYRTVMEDGRPASVLAEVADRVDADLVVVGRRGRGGVAELLLGSVSHELSHHCRRPVLLISQPKVGEKGKQPVTAGAAG